MALDFKAQAENSQKRIIEAIRAIFPYEGQKQTLIADRIWIEVTQGASENFSGQKEAKAKERSWTSPIYGKFRLIDNETRKVVDSVTRMKLVGLPVSTARGSYIVRGNEYQVANQLRIKPGVYTRIQENGELESWVNLAKGMNFKIHLSNLGIFYMTFGTTNIQLYHILTAFGVSRSQIENIWGRELTERNAKKGTPDREISKLYKSIFREEPKADTNIIADIETYFSGNQIDKDTTKTTIGKSFSNVNPELLLRTSAKILGVSRGQTKPDDRDSLEFKSVHSVDDFLGERITKNAHKIKFKMRFNIDKRDKIREIVGSSTFGAPIESFFTGSRDGGSTGLSSTTEQTNPLNMVSETDKLILTGAGGITNPHAITLEARAVHPSSLGFIDPVHSPESSHIGTTLHLPLGVEKRGNVLYTNLYSIKQNKIVQLTPAQASKVVISFRDQYNVKGGKLTPKSRNVKVTSNGKMSSVASGKVEYVIPTAQSIFGVATNMIPFLASDQGNRAMMAAKMMTQALPLIHREAPLVQVVAGKDFSFERAVGEGFSHQSPVSGTVHKVTDDAMIIKDNRGKLHTVNLYRNFPLNSKTAFIDSEPKVIVGSKVKKGQIVADTNFTSNGSLALGVNARVAYIAHKGMNFEDGITISEGFSKRVTSSHMYKMSIQLDPNTVMSLEKFKAYYPEVLDLSASEKLDKDGAVKKGEKVRLGDTILAVLKAEEKGPEDVIMARLHRAFVKPYKNRSVTWDEEDEGTVVDVIKTPKKIEVHIRTNEPAKIGDKLSSRHASKGTITSIISDNEMPQTKDGIAIEVVLNPHGIPSRLNPGQILETVAGKIADKQGKKFEVRNFSGEDYLQSVKRAMKQAGLKDKEDLIDPFTNKTLPGVLTGKQYILKLDHPTRKKFSARAQGPGYTSEMQPTRGKHEGGQSLDTLTLYSMLAHGAKHNLREMSTYKSQKNDEVWRALQLGQSLPVPTTPFAFEKFLAMVKGSGANVTKDGNSLVLAPLTDKDIREFSAGEIKNSQVVRGKDLKPEKGGLFDPKITGGISGDVWNHITLGDPLPNPIMENAIKAVLGITESVYTDLIAGKRWVTPGGAITTQKGADNITGGAGIKLLLSKIKVDEKIEDLTRQAKKKTGSELNKIHKTIRYLKALQKNNMKPQDYILTRVPVIPAKLRPVYALPDGQLDVTEVNYLYKDLIDLNQQYKDFREIGMPESEMGPLRATVYKGMKAVAGLHPHLGGRQYKGLIEQIKGNTNKEGFFQNRIMSRRQEFSGRSTVVPDPNLGLDDVAIPEEMGWKIYQSFIVRELIRQGYKPIDAKTEMEKRSPLAKRALDAVVQNHPVLINRAPSLHKFSIMALNPQITTGKAIKINPLIVKGFNMDFDGDTVAVHVPITEEARIESLKMLPSRNLYSPRSGELMHHPTQEAITGLYLFTQTPKGRARLNSVLPGAKYHIRKPLTGKNMEALLKKIAKESPGSFPRVVNTLKDIGNRHVYMSGFSVGLDDLDVDKSIREKIFSEAEKKIKGAKNREDAIVKYYMEAAEKLDKALMSNKKLKSNAFMIMVNSGAKGNIGQIRQMVAAPVLVKDVHDRIVPVALKKSYAEGLDLADYWSSMSGARKGMIDRALQTAEPGAFAKELLNSTVGHIISEEDCGTYDGIELDVNSLDVLDRFLAKAIKGVGRRNAIVTHDIVKRARLLRKTSLLVRSPLTCESDKGSCRKCYGLDERGRAPEIGTNVGAIAGQAISEPATQMTMRCTKAGTMIRTKHGGKEMIIPIEELFDLAGEAGDSAAVSGLEIWNDGKYVNATHIQRHPKPSGVEMLMVRTRRGDAMIVQDNHPVWICEDPKCKCENPQVRVLSENVYTCNNCRRSWEQKPTSQSAVLAKDISSGTWIPSHGIMGNRPWHEDPNIPGYIAGMYAAEGSTSEKTNGKTDKRYSFSGVCIPDDSIAKKFMHRCDRNGLGCRRNGDSVIFRNGAHPIAKLIPGKAHQKRIIGEFIGFSKNWLAEYLCGYIDGDGTIIEQEKRSTSVRIYSSSWPSAQQVKIICSLLGIPARINSCTFRGEQDKPNKYQPFSVEFKVPEGAIEYLNGSWKWGGSKKNARRYRTIICNGASEITSIKKIYHPDDEYTYDVKVEGAQFNCGGILNHNTFHTGGAAGMQGGITSGFFRIREILEMPRILRGKATLASRSGKITKIINSPIGGKDVYIGDEAHNVPTGRKLLVRLGQNVRKGDSLSDGKIQPQDLLSLRGMRETQNLLVNELQNQYGEQGIRVKRKILETVVRPLTNTVRIIDPGGNLLYIPGDHAPANVVSAWNRDKDEKSEIKFEPMLRGINTAPLMSEDWISRLNFQKLKNTLTEGPAQGWKSDIMSPHAPLAAFAYGAEIGKE